MAPLLIDWYRVWPKRKPYKSRSRLYLLFALIAMTCYRQACKAQILPEIPEELELQTKLGCKTFLRPWDRNVKLSSSGEDIDWSGECKEGMTDGLGVLKIVGLFGEYLFSGGMLRGRGEGYAKVTFPDGRTLTGVFRGGEVGDEVTYTQPDGLIYKGGWIAGTQNGFGIAMFPDGTKYRGAWQLGKETGSGVIEYPSRLKYEGEFKDGLFDGNGQMTGPDGSTVSGRWSAGQLNGRVVAINVNGERYEGDMRRMKKDGLGVYYWPNGSRYEGHWSNNRPDGEGLFEKSQGPIVKGIWNDGCYKQGDQIVALFRPISSCA